MIFFLLVLLFLNTSSQANISQDLTTFFQKMGATAYTDKGMIYKDQSCGYYTGASAFVRNNVRNLSPVTLQMPHARAGCGGIDLFTGGLSFIKSNQLVQVLRSVGQNASSYAFLLAIQTVSPQIYNILQELNALAHQINQANLNSCQMSATMLGGLWPRSDQSSQYLCSSMGSSLGVFSDWAQARQGCGAGGQRSSVLRDRQGLYEDILTPPFNLVWKAIRKKEFLANNKLLAELFMTLSGTLITRETNNGLASQTLPSLADRSNILDAILLGGRIRIYQCDEEALCLNPSLRSVHLEEGLESKVPKLLADMVIKVYDDTPLNEEEIGLLNMTQLPVYKMLNVSAAYRQGSVPLEVHEYTQLIAFDLVLTYVQEILDVVQQAVTEMRATQVQDDPFRLFLASLKELRRRLARKRQEALNYLQATVSLIEKTQLAEKQLHTMMSTLSSQGVQR